jgi:hypothetical protein
MNRTRIRALRFVLLAMTALVYGQLWNNDFIDLDDETLIRDNPHVVEGLTYQGFGWAWGSESPYWMPITWLTFQLDSSLGSAFGSDSPTSNSLNPAVFHGQNLFWHICNVQLLFGLFLRLTGMPWRSFLVAALFAVHPMHVESVAWAIERKDVLMCFFGLLSLFCYVYYVEKRSWVSYLSMLIAYQASLMCKPMLLTLPLILVLLDYWPLRRFHLTSVQTIAGPSRDVRQKQLRSLMLEKVPMLAVAIAMAIQTMATRNGNPMPDVGLFDRLMNSFIGYANYLTKTFYPHGLAAFYPHAGVNWQLVPVLVGAGLMFCCTAVSLYYAKSWRWLSVGWFWFALSLVPVIGLTQGGHQGWADRFSYWPHIGLFLAVVWGSAELAHRFRIPSIIKGTVCALALGTLMILTWIQVGYWRNSIVLWEHAIAVTEDNSFAHERLSVWYRREGRLEEATYHAREAWRILYEKRHRSPLY